MKKVLALVAAVMLLGSTAAMAQASFGIGYMNPNHILLTGDTKTLNGVYAGFDYNIHLTDNFGIAPGVFYSYGTKTVKGGLSIAGFTIADGQVTFTEHYVGIPVNLNYSFKLAPDFALTLYAGPTVSYGIISKSKADANILHHLNVGDDGSLYDDNSNYKPLDVLIGGGVAFDYAEMFRISLGYNYGLLDRDATDNGTFNRSYLHMGVAYLF